MSSPPPRSTQPPEPPGPVAPGDGRGSYRDQIVGVRVQPHDATPMTKADAGEVTRKMRRQNLSQRTRVEIPTLRVVAGRDMLSYIALHNAEEIVIGRDDNADLILTDVLVSRRHARVIVGDDMSITVHDLGSTNGTSVNGQAVERSLLRPGEHLEIGGVSLRLEMLSLEEIEHLSNVVMRLKQQNRDPLTGLLTRSWLEEELPLLMDRSQRTRSSVSCIFFDIDHFKQVNDRFGHHVGDEVLVGVARLLLYGVRDNDPVVRYGGEELVMFLDHADEAHAKEVAERIRRDVQGHDWSRTAAGLKVTISAGVAQWGVASGEKGSVAVLERESARDWMGRADRCLFDAKRAGRNRVVAAMFAAR
ncbi:MAG: diguanylate cyclase [Deltaproteobacteria bacterium]|nr:diguanylate cyclase [Deltaproteobacteria bacterium]